MNRKVWVLGSSNMDITYCVCELPKKGYTVQAKSCDIATGGKGANQAVAAAHWGAETGMIGAVGDDTHGEALINALKLKKVNTDCVSVIPGIASGNAVILVDQKGANCITVYPGANQCIPLDNQPAFCKGDLLVSQLEVNIDAVVHYFSQAKKSGAYTVLNPSPFQPLPTGLIEMTDIVVANEWEASEISGIAVDSVSAAKKSSQKILKCGPSAVVITVGKLGAVAVTKENAIHIPEYPVEVVDTQGAGDAFLGTLAAKLSQGVSLEEACTYANAVASISVSRKGGTQVSLCSLQEIDFKKVAKAVQI